MYEDRFEDIQDDLKPIEGFITGEVMTVCIIILVVLVLLVFIIFNKRVDKSCGYVGVSSFIASIFIAIVAFVIPSVGNLMVDFTVAQQNTFMYAAIFAVIGIALFIIGIILKSLRASIEAKKIVLP